MVDLVELGDCGGSSGLWHGVGLRRLTLEVPTRPHCYFWPSVPLCEEVVQNRRCSDAPSCLEKSEGRAIAPALVAKATPPIAGSSSSFSSGSVFAPSSSSGPGSSASSEIDSGCRLVELHPSKHFLNV